MKNLIGKNTKEKEQLKKCSMKKYQKKYKKLRKDQDKL